MSILAKSSLFCALPVNFKEAGSSLKIKIILMAMALAMVLTLGAKADAVLITLNSGDSATFLYDGATSSPACTFCDGSVTLTFNGSSLIVAFSNTSTDSLPSVNILTSFAFDTTPNLSFSTPQFSGLPSGKTWSFQTSGLGGFEFGSSSNQGINGGLDAGESGSLAVAISSPTGLTSLTIDLTETHFQSINAPGGTSTKPEGCVSGTPDCGGGPGGPGGDPGAASQATQVPEPSTLVLLASGILMLARFRRRK